MSIIEKAVERLEQLQRANAEQATPEAAEAQKIGRAHV